MKILIYDNTFEGLLTVIFEIYIRKDFLVKIMPQTNYFVEDLFAESEKIQTDPAKAKRLLIGLEKKISPKVCHKLFCCFLSEAGDKEELIFKYICSAFESKMSIEEHYTLPFVLKIEQINIQVRREIHRMHAFVRFEKNAEGIYFSIIEPDYNVLPLITEHFEKRFADQSWIIYDLKRKYGFYYDLFSVNQIEIDLEDGHHTDIIAAEPGSENYNLLWQHYFKAVNITERKNIKLHLKHVPRRYWKYLPEKKEL